MNIILRELKSIWKSQLAWCVGILFMVLMAMQKYSGFKESGEKALKMLDSLPAFIKALVGLGDLDLTMASGYYVISFLFFAIMCGIHAIMQGVVVISKEERDKTADFLLVKPVKRSRIITAKLMASLLAVGMLTLVTWGASVVIVAQFNDGKSVTGLISRLMFGLFMLQLLFLSVGMLIGTLARSSRHATGIATGIFMGSFLLSVAVDMARQIAFLRFLTPFKYYDAKVIYRSGYSATYIILTAAIVLTSITLTYLIYQRKDIHV